jgi:predicted RNase H-like nuclease (RuvC/YqgF family)
LDLKSKIDTLSSEIEAFIQNNNNDERKKKELERDNEKLNKQLSDQRKLYEEIKGEIVNFEEKLIEFEERDASQIQTVRISSN